MHKNHTNNTLIIGCGDVGRRVAALHQARDDAVLGLVRRAHSAKSLEAVGIRPVTADLDDPDALKDLLANLPMVGAALYWFAPPPSYGTADPRLDAFLNAINTAALPKKVVYISTTGVYGDTGNAWIDETYPTAPRTERAQRRLWAEHRLQTWCSKHGVPGVILRVPGIYGPGRLPTERLRKGLPVVRETECPITNRIHADDLAQVCVAAMARAPAEAVYNTTDGQPGTMTDYFNRVADLLGLSRPPSVSLAEAQRVLSPTMISYLRESRRISNRRMLEELSVELRHPDLASGLASCLPKRRRPE